MSLHRILRPLSNRIANLLGRGTVLASGAASKMQSLQVSLLAGETKTGVEHFEPYGFTSNPRPGSEVLVTFLDGDRSHGIAVAATDRRYRIRELPAGGVAVYTGTGNSIILNPDGSITLETKTLNIKADTITSRGEWTHTGNLIANHVSLPHHRHTETGTVTEEPTPDA